MQRDHTHKTVPKPAHDAPLVPRFDAKEDFYYLYYTFSQLAAEAQITRTIVFSSACPHKTTYGEHRAS